MADKIRWGIIGTGNIAGAIAEALNFLPDAKLVAVGSRNALTADRFADQHGVAHRHSSYEALVRDPDVDVVYIGTPPFSQRGHASEFIRGQACSMRKTAKHQLLRYRDDDRISQAKQPLFNGSHVVAVLTGYRRTAEDACR